MKLTADNVWFTSDTHYNHKNICRGVTNWNISTEESLDAVRNFETLDKMNSAIVENINSHVDANDWLIHLGDWSFGGFEMIEEFRSMINCKNIVLLLGNHDHHIQRNRGGIQRIFTHVANYEEMRVTQKGETNLVLCHYPILSWNGQRKGAYMIHGHQHLKREKRFGDIGRMDVGICGSPEFRPYHFDEMIQSLEIYRKNNKT